jgi:hypothetical protein
MQPFTGSKVQGLAKPQAELDSLISEIRFLIRLTKESNVEHRTLNVQRRMRNSINLKKIEHHEAQVPARHERILASNFEMAELFDPEFMTEGHVINCGSVVINVKSTKRSAILIRRSMLGVRCSTFNPFFISGLSGLGTTVLRGKHV